MHAAAPHLVRLHLPLAMPAGAVPTGVLSGHTPLQVDIALRPRHQSALASLIRQVTSPASPRYRHYLPAGAFERRFGPAPATVTALERWLAARGLRRTHPAPAGLAIEVRAPAAELGRALGTRFVTWRHGPAGGYTAAAPPLVPAPLAAQISGVLGLDSTSTSPAGLRPFSAAAAAAPTGTPHEAGARRAGGAGSSGSGPAPAPSATCAAAIARSGAGYRIDEIAGYYGFDPLYAAGDLGAGASIGLVEFASYRPSDLAAFDSCYGLQPHVSVVPVDSGPGTGPVASSQAETELDLEIVTALAPGANVVVYAGSGSGSLLGAVGESGAYDAYAKAVAADAVSVISTSWGACEPSLGASAAAAENLLFEQAALQGQTVVAAAGDSGSEDCAATVHGPEADALAVDDPASQPYVTGVGGTTLQLARVASGSGSTAAGGGSAGGGSAGGGSAGGSSAGGASAGGNGTPPTAAAGNGSSGGVEVAWRSRRPSPQAGGGGISQLWPMPPYQLHSAPSLGVVSPMWRCPEAVNGSGTSSSCREVPDVSANAGSPVAVYCTVDEPQLCARGGWSPLGGTSAAAPVWAALFALADSSSACAGKPVGFVNPALYALAGSAGGYTSDFHDVTNGTNDLTGGNGGRYAAGPGYDLATGIGTPVAATATGGGLVAGLCSPAATTAARAGLPVPVVSWLVPASARSHGGARIVIDGSNFTGATAVRFGGRRARFRVVSPTRIVATVPPGRSTVRVTVSNPGGTSRRTQASLFTYLAPLLVALAPARQAALFQYRPAR